MLGGRNVIILIYGYVVISNTAIVSCKDVVAYT